jgi:cellulose synthase/poly-beta-1,6-N-acetylglucosamine synthase-like glycosyltransferase
MLLDILAGLSILYSLQIVVFAFAAFRSRYPSDRSYRPSVSIIVAARNEEDTIGPCLDSLSRLSYPTELLDIVVINDRSTDSTEEVVRQHAATDPHIRLVAALPESGHLRGKTNAVTQGIEASAGEIILFTDADCQVPRGWVEETVKYYNNAKVGIVAGFTALDGSGWFQRVQALDWFYLFSVAAAAIRLRFPQTAVGNNLSVRRTAYDRVGGYRKIPFSVTEDYALFHAVTTQTDFEPRFPLDARTLVTSMACSSWKQLHRQKMRWFTGGRDMSARSLLLFCVSFLFNLLLVGSIPAMWHQGFWLPVLLKCVADVALLLPALSVFGRWRLLLAFPLFEIYYTLYVLLYPPLVLTGSGVIWKERSFPSGA